MKKSIISFCRQKYFPPAAQRFLSESCRRLILQQGGQALKRGGGETGLEAEAIILLWETGRMLHPHSHGEEKTAVAGVLGGCSSLDLRSGRQGKKRKKQK